MNQPTPSPLAPAPQGVQQVLAVLVLTSNEVTLVHQALGELPAKQSEQLRAKIVMQAQSQQQVLADLQGLIAEQLPPKSESPAAPPEIPTSPSPSSNVHELKSKKKATKQTATAESPAQPAVTES